jgi:hypothetical protein
LFTRQFLLFFIIVLVADGEEKYSGKVFLVLVFSLCGAGTAWSEVERLDS